VTVALIGLGLGIAGLLALAAVRPETYRVERSRRIQAPAEIVFAQIEDFRAWAAWSPWETLDPNMKRTYEGPARGAGAAYAWDGNRHVGSGRMTIVESTPPTALACRLEFREPFASVANTAFTLQPDGDRAVAVTWAMDGTNGFTGKLISIFVSMDRMIGGQYERGLATLESVATAAAGRQAGDSQAVGR
jgi:polyketide cyclase/dehydrase/lipid transport protein